jgi:endothelin-converting enzyme/putative endopeptidase
MRCYFIAFLSLSLAPLFLCAQEPLASSSIKSGIDSPQQRFFLGFAQIWCRNSRPESLRNQVRIDPHSPDEFGVVGVVPNNPEFATAFGCAASQPMVSAKACRVW